MPHALNQINENAIAVAQGYSSDEFSMREIEIITALSYDCNVKMIAQDLNLSAFTVQDHIKNIKQKMDVHTSGGVVAQALRSGLIE